MVPTLEHISLAVGIIGLLIAWLGDRRLRSIKFNTDEILKRV